MAPYFVRIHNPKRLSGLLNCVAYHVLLDMGLPSPVWEEELLPCRPAPLVLETHCATHAAPSLPYNWFPLLPQCAKRRKDGVEQHFVDLDTNIYLQFTLTTWLFLNPYSLCQTSCFNTCLYSSAWTRNFLQLACGWRFRAATVTVFPAQLKSAPLSFRTSVIRAHNACVKKIATYNHVVEDFKMWFVHCAHIFPDSTAAWPSFILLGLAFFCFFFAMVFNEWCCTVLAWTKRYYGKSPFVTQTQKCHAKQKMMSSLNQVTDWTPVFLVFAGLFMGRRLPGKRRCAMKRSGNQRTPKTLGRKVTSQSTIQNLEALTWK